MKLCGLPRVRHPVISAHVPPTGAPGDGRIGVTQYVGFRPVPLTEHLLACSSAVSPRDAVIPDTWERERHQMIIRGTPP